MLPILAEGALAHGVKLREEQIAAFERYLKLLQGWRSRVNLVGRDDAETVQRRHFLESIALGAALREREILRPESLVVDVGAGAGFSGVAMKIAWPSIQLTLIEATAKKTAFLSELVRALGWDDVAVYTGRAEMLGHDAKLREHFDLVVARAVAPLPVLLELTLPFARVGGRMATPKGSRVQDEVAASAHALQALGARIFTMPLKVPGPDQTLVVALKQRSTPKEYPRKDGMPAKSPL
jgi:16S rRNA (guanine527-N7)-methyltransferase